jgi:tetratricopeptide (TPR) repeat protein
MAAISPIAHQVEYHRLHLLQDERAGIDTWSVAFDHAWDARLLDLCRRLLAGARSSRPDLTTHSRGVILHSQALMEMALTHFARAEADYRRGLHLLLEAGDRTRTARVLNDLGTLYQAQGRLTDAIPCYRQALAHLLPEAAGGLNAAMVHNNLGLALIQTGDDVAGVAELERAGALYRALDMVRGEVQVQVNLGQVYRQRGESRRALEVYQTALDAVRDLGARRVEVEVLNGMGIAHRHLGQLDQAVACYTASLELAQQLDDLGGQAQAFGNLGIVYELQGKLEQAQQCYAETLRLYELIPDLSGQARMWANLGDIHRHSDRAAESIPCYERSLELYQQCGERAAETTTLTNLATAYRDLDRHDEAEALYLQALQRANEQRNTRLADSIRSALGTLRTAQARWADAEALLQEALQGQAARGDAFAQVETTYKLGILARERGDAGNLLAIVQPGWELAQEHGYVRWLTNIAWLLGDAALEESDFVAFNYYGAAVAVALEHEDQSRFDKGMSILYAHIDSLLAAKRTEHALALCHHLVEFWQSDPFGAEIAPAVDAIKARIEQFEPSGKECSWCSQTHLS